MNGLAACPCQRVCSRCRKEVILAGVADSSPKDALADGFVNIDGGQLSRPDVGSLDVADVVPCACVQDGRGIRVLQCSSHAAQRELLCARGAVVMQ